MELAYYAVQGILGLLIKRAALFTFRQPQAKNGPVLYFTVSSASICGLSFIVFQQVVLVLFHYSVSTADGLSPPGSALSSTSLFFFVFFVFACSILFHSHSAGHVSALAHPCTVCCIVRAIQRKKEREEARVHMCVSYVSLCVFRMVYGYINHLTGQPSVQQDKRKSLYRRV